MHVCLEKDILINAGNNSRIEKKRMNETMGESATI